MDVLLRYVRRVKGIIVAVAVSILILIGLIGLSRDANKGHGLCMSGGLITSCDSPIVKQIPGKIKISHGAKDGK
jgi:hypothetical protein